MKAGLNLTKENKLLNISYNFQPAKKTLEHVDLKPAKTFRLDASRNVRCEQIWFLKLLLEQTLG